MKRTVIQLLMGMVCMITACSEDDGIALNQKPGDFNLLSPQDNTTSISTMPMLEWELADDLDGDSVVYFLYLDDREATTLIAGDFFQNSFTINTPLNNNTNYKWRVVAKDDQGASSRSALFSFTTENDPPALFDLAFPSDNSDRVSIQTQLVWESSSNADGDSITYNIYFGTEENPSLLANDLDESNLSFGFVEFPEPLTYVYFDELPTLEYSTTYYWKVEAVDAQGDIAESIVSSFTTDIKPIWIDINANGFLQIADHSSVVFDNKIWVIDNEIVYTEDGATWQFIDPDHAIGNLFGHTSVVFDNKMWIIGSISKGVWSSTNGTNWTEVNGSPPFSTLTWHTSLVFDNKMWVIGGFTQGPGDFHNEVWYSEDGINWTQATTDVVFTPRYGHSSVVFDGKMWVIGGLGPAGETYNDVWYSSDGINWEQSTDEADFTPRYHHASVVYDDRIWIVGGGNDSGETWFSSDGESWTLLENSVNMPLSTIQKHTAEVFNERIFLLGGSSASTVYDQVWVSDF